MFFKFFFYIGLFFFTSSFTCLAEDLPTIYVAPKAYSKLILRIPPFEGDKEEEYTQLLRNLLNSHLFCLALKEPPFPYQKNKEFFLKGRWTAKNDKFFFQGELSDLSDPKFLKYYQLESNSPYLLIYTLADQIIADISPYKGVSSTQLTFVKRSSKGDTLYLMDFSKKNLKQLRTAPLILFPKFSPSGKKIAYIVYDKERHYYIEIFNLFTKEIKRLNISELSSPLIFSPDEKRVYFSLGKEGEINIYELDLESEKIAPITFERGIYQIGSISSDGKWLAYVGDKTGKPQVYLFNIDSGKIQRISSEGHYHTSPRFSPTKPLLIYLSGKREIIFYNLKTQEKKRLTLPYEITDPLFSPTGDYLLFKGKGGKEKGIYVLHLDSLLIHLYLPYPNLNYPDWGRLSF